MCWHCVQPVQPASCHARVCAQHVTVPCGLSCSSYPVAGDTMAHPALAALDAPDFEGLDTVEDQQCRPEDENQRHPKRRRLASPGLFPRRQERGRLQLRSLVALLCDMPHSCCCFAQLDVGPLLADFPSQHALCSAGGRDHALLCSLMRAGKLLQKAENLRTKNKARLRPCHCLLCLSFASHCAVCRIACLFGRRGSWPWLTSPASMLFATGRPPTIIA